MGYRNDQFYRLPGGDDGGNGPTSPAYGAINPPFLYPDKSIRSMDKDGKRQTDVLEKGYIRQLSTGGDSRVSKCRFQFNPQTIDHAVSMSETLLNFFNQDPAQFAQPLAGQVNFSFSLFFDRSMEMNNYQGGNSPSTTDPWRDGDPGEVGVLRDLASLYEVIGQGMSTKQHDAIKKELETSINLEAADEGEDADPATAISNIPDFLDHNVGNAAFLIPLPVRIVLSSLYMVEGFVRDTSVTFTKFNSALVPMQCVVRMTVSALYVGFATQGGTYLSYALDQREEYIAEEKDRQAREAAAEARVAAISVTSEDLDLGIMNLSVRVQDAGSPMTSWGNVVTSGDKQLVLYSTWENQGQNKIKSLFDSGKNVSLRWSASASVFSPDVGSGAGARPSPIWSASLVSPTFTTLAEWERYQNGSIPKSSPAYAPPVVMDEYSGQSARVDWNVSATLTIDGLTASGRGAFTLTDTSIGGSSPLLRLDPAQATIPVKWEVNGEDVSKVGWREAIDIVSGVS